ncbi:MAG: histidinol-phosphate transaminase [Clostridia bacterium]|nr:histidinol-phosphate transaminase [Clostridia bacterium]MBR4116687.1 histidinol-phosphate transaminase [Clostridia bacterium]
MSNFFTSKLKNLTPYTPGEQPKDMQYIKLNTNESPFAPSKAVSEAVLNESKKLQLYSDPECTNVRRELARVYGVDTNQVIVTNGSDEVLNFAFMAFADEKNPLVFPNITYGFYPVFAELNRIPYTEIPLKDDFTVDINDYIRVNKTVVIANPNAPTGIALTLQEIEKIVSSNPNNVVIIDEAYVDFGAESAVSLVGKYDNLLVVQTFSKSRSMAGARLGFAIGNKSLIADLNTIRYSTNPYNVNRMTDAAGAAALIDNDYYMNNCKTIIDNREWTVAKLQKLDFEVLASKANFVFAKNDKIDGEKLYLELKNRGILVRHFTKPAICQYNRITIGTLEQMQKLIETITLILEEN